MPTGFNIGPLFIHFYGIILMVGAVGAAFLAEREARRRGKNSELVWDGLIWVLIGGIIGARLWHIFTPPPSMVEQGYTTLYYLTHPLDAINTRLGGLGIPGAVIGGAIALYFFSRRRKERFAEWADIAAPALALGQAIGRWGNFINQELYGKPTDLPWGIFIEPQNRLPEFMSFTHFHPLFLYESLWNFANMGFLLWIGRRYPDKLKAGDLFLMYLIGYPVGRFLLEFLRLDSAQIAGINANQTFMLVVMILAAGLLFWRHRQSGPTVING
ncbi:MAG: prolipoprotein diacylglyceryl transferase [Anaerolineales bacterium]|nr:MAG: prolipoprotein diacylglyceryl transferase [Anaerolineales bacterium]